MYLSARKYYAAQRLATRLSLPKEEVIAVVRAEPRKLYRSRYEAKKDGGERLIDQPHPLLAKIQKAIYEKVFRKCRFSNIVHGQVPGGRSIVSCAACHINSRSLVAYDILDAFGSINFWDDVVPWVKFDLEWPILEVIADLVETGGARERYPRAQKEFGGIIGPRYRLPMRQDEIYLPQGAPTSPILFNLACARMDAKLERLAQNVGGVVTRYTDNIFFSMPKDVIHPELVRAVKRVIEHLPRIWTSWKRVKERYAFRINTKKTRVIQRGNRQGVPLRMLGINIMERDLFLTPKAIEHLRMALYCAGRAGDFATYNGIKGYVLPIYGGWPSQLEGVFQRGLHAQNGQLSLTLRS